MQFIPISREEVDFWCPLCGTKNVSDSESQFPDGPEIKSCPHFEGVLAFEDALFGDANRIFAAAQEKIDNYENAVEEGHTKEESLKKFNLPPLDDGDVNIFDVLRKDLSDDYVAFYTSAPAPNPTWALYLYNMNWHKTTYD